MWKIEKYKSEKVPLTCLFYTKKIGNGEREDDRMGKTAKRSYIQ